MPEVLRYMSSMRLTFKIRDEQPESIYPPILEVNESSGKKQNSHSKKTAYTVEDRLSKHPSRFYLQQGESVRSRTLGMMNR